MTDLETRLAQARESLTKTVIREDVEIVWYGFDAAAKIAREVVAEKDAHLAQALGDLAKWEAVARDSIKYGLEKDAEIARLKEEIDVAWGEVR